MTRAHSHSSSSSSHSQSSNCRNTVNSPVKASAFTVSCSFEGPPANASQRTLALRADLNMRVQQQTIRCHRRASLEAHAMSEWEQTKASKANHWAMLHVLVAEAHRYQRALRTENYAVYVRSHRHLLKDGTSAIGGDLTDTTVVEALRTYINERVSLQRPAEEDRYPEVLQELAMLDLFRPANLVAAAQSKRRRGNEGVWSHLGRS